MVLNISRRIIAALRNSQFFSIFEINEAIREELTKFIHRPFQKMAGNRLTAFEKIDKPCLQPLPTTKYQYAEWEEAKIGFNYHVEFDGYFYSVDHTYINSTCSIRATSKTIEIYIGSQRVAAYPRNYNPYKRYKTTPEHMPENHKTVYGWSPERFLSWAEKTGPNTRDFINHILESREYPVQTYRTCMGIMRLGSSHSREIMEAACREALDKNTISFKYFSIILKQVAAKVTRNQPEKIVTHDNVRGSNAFAGGGINA